MLTLHSWGTPNGQKITIMLEELDVPYRFKPVNIGKDEQFAPEFLKISPNNKIPALVDDEVTDPTTGEPFSVFESGAILIYLADKYGKFLPASGPERYKVIEWLMWQMGGLGPMLGQMGHFLVFAPEQVPYAQARYTNEATRLLGVLEKRLTQSEYVGGPDYSIADMAIYPWLNGLATFYKQGHMMDGLTHITAWREKLAAREGIKNGMAFPGS